MSSDGHSATCTINENWSEDGIGYGTSGPYGVYDVLTGQKAATTPQSYPLWATFTITGTVSGYTVSWGTNSAGYAVETEIPFSVPFTIPSTAVQPLWICGTDAVPLTSAGQVCLVANGLNPQTHP